MTKRFDAFLQRLTSGERLLLDGGVGTELKRRGIPTPLPNWSAHAIMSHPDAVKKIHEDYIAAGADIIMTNTFRTNRRTFAKIGRGDDTHAYTLRACELAVEARSASGNDAVLIAGAVAPLEDCFRPDLVPPDDELHAEHSETMRDLQSAGVDFLFPETFNCIRESVIALQEAVKTGLPVAVSFVCDTHGDLLSGETIESAVAAVTPYKPFMVLTNCSPAETIGPSLKRLIACTTIPVGIYANGDGHPHDDGGWVFDGSHTPQTFAHSAQGWLDAGARIIGGCCGTSPEYIKAIAPLVRAATAK